MKNNKHTAIKDATVVEDLTNAEMLLRNLVRKANAAMRSGKPMITAEYLSIQAGLGLSSVRAAKHMLGVPTIEPRTPRR
jgi:hypothetical protein